MKNNTDHLVSAIWVLLIFTLCGLIQNPVSHAEEPQKVAILPFSMHSERNLDFLSEGMLDMLASRLYWKGKVVVIEKGLVKKAMGEYQGPINSEYATSLGRKLRADFVLFGSLTLFGESVSLDATVVNLKKKGPLVTVFSQTKGMESVIPEIHRLSQKVNAEIFGRPSAPTELTPLPQPPAPKEKKDESGVSPLNPSFKKYHRVDVQGTSFWKSKPFKTEIRGMDIGDVDGDGQNEVVLLEGTDIAVYRYNNGHLQKLATHRSSDQNRFLAVDVADVNGNGRAEIFASRVSETSVTSVVLEMEGGRLKPRVEESPWLFRVMSWPGGGTTLLGQKKIPGSSLGYDDTINIYFESGISALSWNGSTYVESEEEPLLELPDIFVYNFAIGDLSGDQIPEIVMIDQFDKLHILDNKGEEIYKGTDYFGGTLNFFVANPDTSHKRRLDEELIYIPARILILDLDKDGINDIIINQNESSTFRTTDRWQAFSEGKIVSLSWTGLSLDPNWETQRLSGSVSDYQVKDLDNDGRPDLVVCLIEKRGVSVFREARSVVVSYQLTTEETE